MEEDFSEKIALATKRHKLEIINETHKDEGGPGRDLYLVWRRDVHNPPQTTEKLHQGTSDTKKSRGIGNGHNFRHFDVTVYRWKDGEKKRVGSFVHSIYANALENGHKETTKIFKNYTADKVQLWREWFDHLSERTETEPVGSLPRDEW